MKKLTHSICALSAMQFALLGAGLGSVAQAEKANSEMVREARQSRIEAAYKAASKKISSGSQDPKVLETYSRLRRLVSLEIRRVF